MSKMTTRNWSAEEKVAIVLSSLPGEVSIGEASSKYRINYKTLLAWRD